MSWQQRLYEDLTQDPHSWVKLGDLYEKYRLELPLHLAMRYAHRIYKDGRDVLPEKAEWMYFGQQLRVMGVDRDGPVRQWAYTDYVRISRVEDRSCLGCHGPVINASWAPGKKNKRVRCIACGAVQLYEGLSPYPPVRTFPSSTSPSPPPSPSTSTSTPSPTPLSTLQATPEPTTLSAPTPTITPPSAPPSTSTPSPSPILTLLPTSNGIGDTTFDLYSHPTAESAQAYVDNQGHIPVRAIDRFTLIGTLRSKIFLVWKGETWEPRDLAKHFKTMLNFFSSINSILRDLEHFGYSTEKLLEKHNLRMEVKPITTTVGNRPLESFQHLARGLQQISG